MLTRTQMKKRRNRNPKKHFPARNHDICAVVFGVCVNQYKRA